MMEYMPHALRTNDGVTGLRSAIEPDNHSGPLRLAEIVGDESLTLITEIRTYDYPRPHITTLAATLVNGWQAGRGLRHAPPSLRHLPSALPNQMLSHLLPPRWR